MTLLDFLGRLRGDTLAGIQLRDWFQNDPQAALGHYGLGHLTAEDVHDAMVLVQDNDTVGFDRDYDTGSAGLDWTWGKGGHAPAPPYAGAPEHWGEHVTNNQVADDVDDRDTIIDQSVNQNIDTGGRGFDQHIDNHSVFVAGSRVVAGSDSTGSRVTPGDHNSVGGGNQVVGDGGNITAFGSGGAVKDVSIEAESPFSVDDSASGNDPAIDTYNRDWSANHDRSEIDDAGNVDIGDSSGSHPSDHSQTEVAPHDGVNLDLG